MAFSSAGAGERGGSHTERDSACPPRVGIRLSPLTHSSAAEPGCERGPTGAERFPSCDEEEEEEDEDMLRSSWPAGPAHPLHRPLSLSPDRARSLSLESEPPSSFLVRSAALEDLTAFDERQRPLEVEELRGACAAAAAISGVNEGQLFGYGEQSAAYGPRQITPERERRSAPNPSGSPSVSASSGLGRTPQLDGNSGSPWGKQLQGKGPVFPSPPPSTDSSPLGPAERENAVQRPHGDDGGQSFHSATGPLHSDSSDPQGKGMPVGKGGDAKGSEKKENGASSPLLERVSQSSPARKSYVPVAQFKGLLCYAH